MYDALCMDYADSCWKCYNNTLSHQEYNKEYNHLNWWWFYFSEYQIELPSLVEDIHLQPD